MCPGHSTRVRASRSPRAAAAARRKPARTRTLESGSFVDSDGSLRVVGMRGEHQLGRSLALNAASVRPNKELSRASACRARKWPPRRACEAPRRRCRTSGVGLRVALFVNRARRAGGQGLRLCQRRRPCDGLAEVPAARAVKPGRLAIGNDEQGWRGSGVRLVAEHQTSGCVVAGRPVWCDFGSSMVNLPRRRREAPARSPLSRPPGVLTVALR